MTTDKSPEMTLCFCRSMRRASNRLLKVYAKALAPCELKPLEFAVLAEIRSGRAQMLSELADVFQFDRYTLRYRLAPLQKMGLVEISADARDARSRRASLTKKGLARLDAATPLWHEAQSLVEQTIGASEAAFLRSNANVLASSVFAEAIAVSV